MSKKAAVPDAWDDEWVSLADTQDKNLVGEGTVEAPKLSKAERRAQHAELNKKIWESAENPDSLLFLEARDEVPAKATFKPNVTVLSRKPPPQVLSRSDPASSMAGLKLEDDDEDSEEEKRKKREEAFAERQARAQRDREEKERRYAEARQRLFGTPASNSEDSAGDRASPNRQSRGKGRLRGNRDSPSRSSTERSPAGSVNSKRLYDPNYTAKPNSAYVQRQESGNSRPATPSQLSQPVREPRGPQVSGRGGNGFAQRGARHGSTV